MTNVYDEQQWRIKHPTLSMRVARWFSDLLYRQPENPSSWLDDLPEAFGAVDEHGDVFIIGYKGQWYEPVRPGLRARLRNWFVAFESRKIGGDAL